MRRKMKWMAAGAALLLAAAPMGGALADNLDNMDGNQLNESWVLGSENALEGSGSQASLVGGSANTGSGSQANVSNDSSVWEAIFNANAGSGAQLVNSPNSNGGDRESSDVLISMGSAGAVTNADLGASVTGNSVDVSNGSADSSLSMAGADSGFSGLYGVSAVAASSGADSSQNVSVNVGAEVLAF